MAEATFSGITVQNMAKNFAYENGKSHIAFWTHGNSYKERKKLLSQTTNCVLGNIGLVF